MLKDLLLLLKAMASTTSKPSVHLGNMTFAWSQAWLPDGDSQLFRSYVFVGPLGF